MDKKRRIVIGITGASGAPYAVDLLKKLRLFPEIEVHGVISKWAEFTLQEEADVAVSELAEYFDCLYDNQNLGAAIASGSFLADSMVIVPASMKTVAAIAHGYSDNLISRAADVMLKEQRKLIMVPRETPLNVIHLENLLKLAQNGVKIVPPMPAFYNHPQNVAELIEHQTMKLLDSLQIEHGFGKRWQ